MAPDKPINISQYNKKIIKYKFQRLYRILIILAIVIAIILIFRVQYNRHVYNSYELMSFAQYESSDAAKNIRLGDSILTYSTDGAHCTDIKGNVKWNQTYGIQDILIATCNGTVAIGNYNGHDIYVANEKEILGSIITTMPIKNITVSETGDVTAVLEDSKDAIINTYSAKGDLKYNGVAHMNNSGYPTALSLSPNGEVLAIAYTYADNGEIKTNIAFYNLGDVGENYNDFIVSTYSYTDLLVPKIMFLDNDTVFAIGDERIMVYKGSHKPVLKAEYLLDEKIKTVFYDDKHVAVTFFSDKAEYKYRTDIYDSNSIKLGSFYTSFDYTDIFFEKNTFTIMNDKECYISTYDGYVKFDGSFDKSVELMIPQGNGFKYNLILKDSIEAIRLK